MLLLSGGAHGGAPVIATLRQIPACGFIIGTEGAALRPPEFPHLPFRREGLSKRDGIDTAACDDLDELVGGTRGMGGDRQSVLPSLSLLGRSAAPLGWLLCSLGHRNKSCTWTLAAEIDPIELVALLLMAAGTDLACGDLLGRGESSPGFPLPSLLLRRHGRVLSVSHV